MADLWADCSVADSGTPMVVDLVVLSADTLAASKVAPKAASRAATLVRQLAGRWAAKRVDKTAAKKVAPTARW